MPPDARTDLEACRALLRAGSKSFSTAALLLPPRVRDSATAVYAFCRVADDEVDGNPDATTATVDALRERLRRIYAGQPDDSPVDRSLARVVEKGRVPFALPDALLEGFAWDADGRTYETIDDLHAYAARVAGAVGAIMTVLMGRRAPNVLARACDLGVAMQLTNVARDVGEDASRGRLYLPRIWMRDVGIDPDAWLARPTADDRVAEVVARTLDAADVLYRRADEGIACLPTDCRTAIRAARLIYSDIGRVIARANFDSVTRRAVVPAWRKVWLLTRAMGARFWTPAPANQPPLGATRFLVSACEEGS